MLAGNRAGPAEAGGGEAGVWVWRDRQSEVVRLFEDDPLLEEPTFPMILYGWVASTNCHVKPQSCRYALAVALETVTCGDLIAHAPAGSLTVFLLAVRGN